MSDMVNVKINGFAVQVPKGTSVLEAARAASVTIPTLCYLKDINEIGACRMCMVEANEGRGFRLVAACVYPVSEGMEVLTNSPKVLDSRRKTMELILSNHDMKCLSCVRSKNCELQQLANDLGINSLELADLVLYCEDKYGIEIEDDALQSFITVNDVVEYLTGLVENK